MNLYTVEFIRENKTIQVEEGTTILQAERMAGLSPDAPCGGSGKCGKCLVRISGHVENSAPSPSFPNFTKKNFTEKDCPETSFPEKDSPEAKQIVKACRTEIHSDLKVETFGRASSHKILLAGSGRETVLNPSLEMWEITIPPCKSGESTSDWERLCEALENACGSQINVQPNLKLLSKIAALVKQHKGKAQAVLSGNCILDVREVSDRPLLMAAFDVGTTSVAGYLLDAQTGEQLGSDSALNPQTEYGADVIMRANYALEQGTRELSVSIRVLLKNMLKNLCEKSGCDTEDVYQVSVVGNTCMHHLFLGISPESLVLAPYNPAISQPLVLPAENFRLGVNPGAQLVVLPVIAGFVGADTVACLVAVNLEDEEKMTLMIDIGTNGEIVLGNKVRRIACSTAAGPAFEGAKIACGMRGARGAIEYARMKDGRMECTVIGGGKAEGICGSGLIDIIAALLDAGIIDESGKLLESPQTVEIGGKPAYLLFSEAESGNGKPVYLSQKDIREVQLAKGAIAAGIHLLAVKLGISLEEIEQVYIAGAFGNYMDPAGACRLGLIPPVLFERIIPIGNAAGEGAKLALLNKEEFRRARRLGVNTEFLELASMAEFQDWFVEELEFPE